MNNNLDYNLIWLFSWFYNQCDGDWEHGKGIQIGTLSNPGWFKKIDLEETELQSKEFKKISQNAQSKIGFFAIDKMASFRVIAAHLIFRKCFKFSEIGLKIRKKAPPILKIINKF